MFAIENQVVEAKSRKGNAIKIGEDWYSTYSANDLTHVEKGDAVTFQYVEKGQYKNIKGKVSCDAAPDRGLKTSSGGGKKNFNLGVELGHAANLAMQMTLAGENKPGTPDFLREFANNTKTMFNVMNGLRADAEAGDMNITLNPVKAVSEPPSFEPDTEAVKDVF